MDLVDRYLQAVAFWLPRSQKRDIVAELSEDIRSEMEERESSLGRALTEVEASDLLKRRGRPFAVAAGYLPKDHLIGPALFPVYRLVLKIVAACYLIPWAFVWWALWGNSPVFRAAHGGRSWTGTLATFWGRFWLVCLLTVGIVTIVFAVLERYQARAGASEDWDPRRLPAARDPIRIPRGATVGELAGHLVFVVLWISVMSSPVILDRPDVRITLAPAWTVFFWSCLGLWLVAIATSGANLFRPSWTPLRAGVRLATDVAGVVIFGAFCASRMLRDVMVAGVAPEKTAAIAAAINLVMSRAIPFVVLVGVLVAAADIRRIVRVRAAGDEPRTGLPRASP